MIENTEGRKVRQFCDRCWSGKEPREVMVRLTTSKRSTRKLLCDDCIEQASYDYVVKVIR